MNYSTLKKTVALSAVCLMAFGAAKAQTTDTTKTMSSDMASAKTFGGLSQYNHWSIGINAGVTNDLINFTNNATSHFKPQLGYGISLSDQLSHFFTLALSYNGGKVEGDDVNSGVVGSKYGGEAFQTSFNQATLNGIIDFGSVSFLHRQNAVDFYGSAGAGFIWYDPKYDLAGEAIPASGYNHTYGHTVVAADAPIGVGVKFKLSDALALSVGYTVNLVQAANFQGFHTTYNANSELMDRYTYSYAGLAYTFGSSSKKNIEWVNPIAMMYDELYDAALRQEVKALEGRVTNVETAVADLKKDSDGDGVSDQFDKCPGTPAGTPVDGSGCPLPKIDTTAFCAYCQPKSDAVEEGNVQFDFDSYGLRTSSYPLLDRIAANLKASGGACLIAGYASPDEKNRSLVRQMQLSKDRANAVKNYLINSGVDPKKLKFKGYGIANPIDPNSTEAGRELNRRVEFHNGAWTTGSKQTIRIYFKGNSSNPADDTEDLNKAVEQIKSFNNAQVTIIGHASPVDNVDISTDPQRIKLSTERADAVKNYLIARGISSAWIISSKGAGVMPAIGQNEKANARSVDITIITQ